MSFILAKITCPSLSSNELNSCSENNLSIEGKFLGKSVLSFSSEIVTKLAEI